MSQGIPYADIVILALVAGFIILRLRSVLGSRPEDDVDFMKRDVRPQLQQQADPIVQIDAKSSKPKPRDDDDPFLAALGEGDKADALKAIKEADPFFTATSFVEGARRAYEMVFDAFAKGDKPTLKMLLSDALYDTFSGEIDARPQGGEKSETTLVSVTVEEMLEATLVKNIARISLSFQSEQVTVVRNDDGQIVGGDASDIHHAQDSWTFERDITSKNPNWKIIET